MLVDFEIITPTELANVTQATYETQRARIEHSRQLGSLARILECWLRRDIDVIGALLFLVVCAPILVLIAALIVCDGRRIFFAHRRVGLHGMMFDCWKFRTMVLAGDQVLAEHFRLHPEAGTEWELNQKLTYDPRVTRVGRFLRKWSLDEIPQMWNVVRGHMSLVGPRPVTEAEVADRYGPLGAVLTSVRPGLTGLWQVSGRNDLDYGARIQLDMEYVRSQSLVGDIGILLRTIPAVLRCTGSR